MTRMHAMMDDSQEFLSLLKEVAFEWKREKQVQE